MLSDQIILWCNVALTDLLEIRTQPGTCRLSTEKVALDGVSIVYARSGHAKYCFSVGVGASFLNTNPRAGALSFIGGYNSPNAARAWTYMTSIAVGSVFVPPILHCSYRAIQLGCPLSPEADIPDHAAFPLYAPSFTLDVPPGNVQDQNTPQYLKRVETQFVRIAEMIEQRVGSR